MMLHNLMESNGLTFRSILEGKISVSVNVPKKGVIIVM